MMRGANLALKGKGLNWGSALNLRNGALRQGSNHTGKGHGCAERRLDCTAGGDRPDV